MLDQEKSQVEITEKPEYSDLIINDIMLHGNEQRNPKEWYPEFLHNSKLGQAGRIYSDKENRAVYTVEGLGTIIEQRFPVSPETADLYNQATTSGRGFKLYVPKQGVKVLFHESLKERIRAGNKKLGFNKFNTDDGFYGKLYTFDIIDGVAIIRVLI